MRQIILLLFMSVARATMASPPIMTEDNLLNDLVITPNKGAELKLEVTALPLSQVLNRIAFKSRVPIHYSVLPEGLVTATCVGSTLKQILECLLDKKTNFIMSYTHPDAAINQKEQASEVWILGSKFEGTEANNGCTSIQTAGDDRSLTLQKNENTDNSEADQTKNLLIMAQSKDAAERASAMSQLLGSAKTGDPHVKAILEQGLTDTDANVRAQAISSLAHREGNVVLPAIQEALRDRSADVRLMAVDGITDDVALLQQAINDNDEAVRNLAKLKLDALMHAK